MEENQARGIIGYEESGYEINIIVLDQENNLLEDSCLLDSIVDLAVEKGYGRFVGASQPYDSRIEWTFFFSIIDYFDEDDMLVRHQEAAAKISPILKKKLKELSS